MSRQYRPNAGFWIRMWVLILYPVDSLLFRIRWVHIERMPAPSTAVIVAVNHIGQLDTIAMARMVWQAGRIPRFMAKASMFSWPLIGTAMRGAGHIPVQRGTAGASQSLTAAVAALDRGECIVIYPEGAITRDPNCWPMAAKTGVARLVMARPETPVVPVGQWGLQRRDRMQRLLPVRRTVKASMGEPLFFTEYAGGQSTTETLREITELVMVAIRSEVAVLRGEHPPDHFYRPGVD